MQTVIKHIFISLLLISSRISFAQLTTNTGVNPQELVQNTLIGPGVTVSNITFNGSPSSIGSFTGTGSSPITVSGLSNGTAYTFTVTATNANGTSTASSASNSITPVAPVYSLSQTFNSSGNFTVPAGKTKVAVAVILIVYEPTSAESELTAVKSNEDPESTKVSQVGKAVPSDFVAICESVN